MLKEIWPSIYNALDCEFHIYGANCPKADTYDVPGVVVQGPMKSLSDLSKYKGLLAYLRFGAGVKGKITDSFFYGLPVITTSIGSESISPFPGFIANDPKKFIETAINKYSTNEIFEFQKKGFKFLSDNYSRKINEEILKNHLNTLTTHPIQNILFSETIRSSMYFSKYIESKEKKI